MKQKGVKINNIPLVELIDWVKVVDKDTVEVVFSFGDCYKEVLEGLYEP